MAPTFWILTPPRGRDIHPPYFCGPRHLCQNVLPMCFRVAPSMQGFLSPKFPSLRNIHPVGCARFFLFPFSFSFPFPLSFSPVPFPFSFPFLRSLSSSLFSFFPFSFLLTLSPSPFFFSFLLSLLHFLSLYKWNAAVTYRWRNPQSWFQVGFFPFGALFARLFKSNWMALSQVVAPSIIHDCFSLQHLTSTGRALFHQSFDYQKSFPERRILNLKRGRWRNFVHVAHVGLRHLQAHWLFRV